MDNQELIIRLKTPSSFNTLADKMVYLQKVLMDDGMDQKTAALIGDLYMKSVHNFIFKEWKDSILMPEELLDNPTLYIDSLIRTVESHLVAYVWENMHPKLPMHIIPSHARYLIASPSCIDTNTKTTLAQLAKSKLKL